MKERNMKLMKCVITYEKRVFCTKTSRINYVVVPDKMRKGIVIRFHDLNGRPGIEGTLNLMR